MSDIPEPKRPNGNPSRKNYNKNQMSLDNDGNVITEDIVKLERQKVMQQNGSIMKTPNYDPNDVTAVMNEINYWRMRGLSDRCFTDDDIQERVKEYLDHCSEVGVKPTIETFGLAIGYSRMMLSRWKQGDGCTRERQAIIQSVYDTFAAFDALMTVNGKLNPIVYFFRSKNYYDMRDQQDIVVAPRNPLGDPSSEDDLRKRIEADVVVDDDDTLFSKKYYTDRDDAIEDAVQDAMR